MIFGELNDHTRILGGISYGSAKITKANGSTNGKKAWGAPRYTATIGVEWDTPWNKDLTLSARMIHTAKQYIDSANTMRIPSSTIFDLWARYRTKIGGTNATFRLAVNNLFNKNYWGGMRADTVLFIGRGRTFQLTATFDL